MTLLLFVILFVLSIQTSQSKITEITMVTSWVTLSMTVRSTTWIKKKDAAIYLLTKQISKIILTIFDKDILKDFQKIFQSRPIPGLYLKRFRS